MFYNQGPWGFGGDKQIAAPLNQYTKNLKKQRDAEYNQNRQSLEKDVNIPYDLGSNFGTISDPTYDRLSVDQYYEPPYQDEPYQDSETGIQQDYKNPKQTQGYSDYYATLTNNQNWVEPDENIPTNTNSSVPFWSGKGPLVDPKDYVQDDWETRNQTEEDELEKYQLPGDEDQWFDDVEENEETESRIPIYTESKDNNKEYMHPRYQGIKATLDKREPLFDPRYWDPGIYYEEYKFDQNNIFMHKENSYMSDTKHVLNNELDNLFEDIAVIRVVTPSDSTVETGERSEEYGDETPSPYDRYDVEDAYENPHVDYPHEPGEHAYDATSDINEQNKDDYADHYQEVQLPGHLGMELHNWHAGMNDPIYKVGSLASAGKPIDKELVQDAIDNLESLRDKVDGEDYEELVNLIGTLQDETGLVTESKDPVLKSLEELEEAYRGPEEPVDEGEPEGGSEAFEKSREEVFAYDEKHKPKGVEQDLSNYHMNEDKQPLKDIVDIVLEQIDDESIIPSMNPDSNEEEDVFDLEEEFQELVHDYDRGKPVNDPADARKAKEIVDKIGEVAPLEYDDFMKQYEMRWGSDDELTEQNDDINIDDQDDDIEVFTEQQVERLSEEFPVEKYGPEQDNPEQGFLIDLTPSTFIPDQSTVEITEWNDVEAASGEPAEEFSGQVLKQEAYVELVDLLTHDENYSATPEEVAEMVDQNPQKAKETIVRAALHYLSYYGGEESFVDEVGE